MLPSLVTQHENESTNASVLSAALSSLVVSGASWKTATVIGDATVRTLSGIRYGQDSPLQSLDLYFPNDAVSQHLWPSDTFAPPPTSTPPPPPPRPVYVHIHGGGWSRGDRASPFYGGPAMSQNAAAHAGCIAVAPGYRLGIYPGFVHDAAAAVRWVLDNIAELGGDPSRIFLSGHSAGAHIASLLMLRHASFLRPLGIPPDFARGLVLVSGVYDLFSPMRTAPIDAKNKWFVLAYVLPAFGKDERLRREASPLLLLDPNKDTSVLGRAATWVTGPFRLSDSPIDQREAASPETGVEVNTTALPPTLILNASVDMGLQENGELMAAAMGKYTDVKYALVSGTDHASICSSPKTADEMKEFIAHHTS